MSKTIKKPKYYTAQEVSDKFQKLTKDEKINVLYEAIDYMQSYNGRSKMTCIALAMGYDDRIGDNKSYFKKHDND